MKYGSFNHCNLPPWIIVSRHFNDNPHSIHIQGVLENSRFLFNRLDSMEDSDERAQFFNDFMSVKFHLHHWEEQNTEAARMSIRNSFLRFLKGWMIDSNSTAGAVMKHWVERRIGISPTYHNGTIYDTASEAYQQFLMDAAAGSLYTSAIDSQFDMLYEFGQYELKRRYPGIKTVTLYRGTHDAEEYEILENCGKREQIVRMNNLVSFTKEAERAWEFGRTVWKTSVPISKIFFFSGLLPGNILKGEDEYLIFGGEYRVFRMR